MCRHPYDDERDIVIWCQVAAPCAGGGGDRFDHTLGGGSAGRGGEGVERGRVAELLAAAPRQRQDGEEKGSAEGTEPQRHRDAQRGRRRKDACLRSSPS